MNVYFIWMCLELYPCLSHPVCCDRPGSSLGSVSVLPPFPVALCPLAHPLFRIHFPSHGHSQQQQSTKALALPRPAGLPGDHGVVSGSRNIWGVVCAHGHGASHSLQQCAGLRPQHWRRHRSERHHWCKSGWSAHTHLRRPTRATPSVYQRPANQKASVREGADCSVNQWNRKHAALLKGTFWRENRGVAIEILFTRFLVGSRVRFPIGILGKLPPGSNIWHFQGQFDHFCSSYYSISSKFSVKSLRNTCWVCYSERTLKIIPNSEDDRCYCATKYLTSNKSMPECFFKNV